MLDLVKILKDCPKGTKLYSTIHGEVVLNLVDDTDINYPIVVKNNCSKIRFTYDFIGKAFLN